MELINYYINENINYLSAHYVAKFDNHAVDIIHTKYALILQASKITRNHYLQCTILPLIRELVNKTSSGPIQSSDDSRNQQMRDSTSR